MAVIRESQQLPIIEVEYFDLSTVITDGDRSRVRLSAHRFKFSLVRCLNDPVRFVLVHVPESQSAIVSAAAANQSVLCCYIRETNDRRELRHRSYLCASIGKHLNFG